MFSIQDRGARIGNQIGSRGEQHGDESVTAVDIPLDDIMLDERELNALLREPHAYRCLYNVERGGSVVEPMFPHVKPIALKDKIEEARVVIDFGLDDSITIVPAKIAKIKLEPRTGGLTAMSCTVQSTPELGEQLARLLGKINHDVVVSIDGGQFGAQKELPLNAHGEGEQPSQDPEHGDEPDEAPEREREPEHEQEEPRPRRRRSRREPAGEMLQ
jgi:hypothetical protein